MIRKLHYISGITIAVFVGIHLLNHVMLFESEQAHIRFMETARLFYRNPIVETILLIAVITQVVSGITLVRKKWNNNLDGFDRLQVYSGLFLSYFLIAHVSAVMMGRFVLNLDTNLYFGVGVLNNNPAFWYFILHYGLAIMSIFTHLACVHKTKMVSYASERGARTQAVLIIGVGVIVAIALVSRMMNVTIPREYQFLPFGRY